MFALCSRKTGTHIVYSVQEELDQLLSNHIGGNNNGVLLNAFVSSIEEMLVSSHIEDRQGGPLYELFSQL